MTVLFYACSFNSSVLSLNIRPFLVGGPNNMMMGGPVAHQFNSNRGGFGGDSGMGPMGGGMQGGSGYGSVGGGGNHRGNGGGGYRSQPQNSRGGGRFNDRGPQSYAPGGTRFDSRFDSDRDRFVVFAF